MYRRSGERRDNGCLKDGGGSVGVWSCILASDVGNPSKTEVIRNAVVDWPSYLCQNESREETVCLNHLGCRDKEARNEDHGEITKSASRSILSFFVVFFSLVTLSSVLPIKIPPLRVSNQFRDMLSL